MQEPLIKCQGLLAAVGASFAVVNVETLIKQNNFVRLIYLGALLLLSFVAAE